MAGITSAVASNPDGSYYCVGKNGPTLVSGLDPRWAVAVMLGNCGLGSQMVRFFVERDSSDATAWHLSELKYEALGTGQTVPCGSAKVPADIRCA